MCYWYKQSFYLSVFSMFVFIIMTITSKENTDVFLCNTLLILCILVVGCTFENSHQGENFQQLLHLFIKKIVV